jgi:uncharacterized protein
VAMGEAVDAGVLREAMARYLDVLREHREELDSLNVFPVPDGDTGTNLLFTQQAVADAVEAADAADLSVVGEAITGAALMGARGNSGVILSQVLRGLCSRLCPGARTAPRCWPRRSGRRRTRPPRRWPSRWRGPC